MGTTEEFLRLLVEVKGAQALPDLKKALDDVGKETKNLKALFEQSAISEELLVKETMRLAEANVHLNAQVQKVSGTFGPGFQQKVTAASYAFQDFTSTSGDLGQKLNSISNNLAGIIGTAGPAGVAISTLAVAAIAIYRQWDQITALWENRTPILDLKASLGELEEELKRNAKATEELRSKGDLSNAQMNEYNRLTREAIELEKTLATQREIEAAKKAHGALSSEAAKGRATGMTKAVEELGGFDAVVGQIVSERTKISGVKHNAETLAMETQFIQQELTKAMKGDEAAISMLTAGTTKGGRAATDLTDLSDAYDPVKKQKREAYEKGVAKLTEDTQKKIDTQTKADEHIRDAGAAFAEKETARVEPFGEKMKAIAEKAYEYQRKQAEKGTTDEEAHVAAAQLRAAGGYTNARGKFIPLDEGGQREVLEADVRKRLPGLSGSAQKAVAGGIAGQAFSDVDRQKGEMQALGTMSAMEINQAIIANNEAILNKQIQELRGKVDATGRALNAVNITSRHRQTTVPGS